eukprot:143819-Prorocentrum_minimum.AAC.6
MRLVQSFSTTEMCPSCTTVGATWASSHNLNCAAGFVAHPPTKKCPGGTSPHVSPFSSGFCSSCKSSQWASEPVRRWGAASEPVRSQWASEPVRRWEAASEPVSQCAGGGQ